MDHNAEYDTNPGQACPNCGAYMHHSRKEQVSVNERIKRAIQILHLSRLSLVTALITVLDPSEQDFTLHRGKIYESTKLHQLLDYIHDDLRGSVSLLTWMEPRSIDFVLRKVYSEMDSIKDDVRLEIDSMTPEFLGSWDIGPTIGAAMADRAPTLSKLLFSACQTTHASKENTTDYKIVSLTLYYVRALLNFYCSHVKSSLRSSRKFGPTVAYISLHPSHSSCGQMEFQGKRSKPSRSVGSASRLRL